MVISITSIGGYIYWNKYNKENTESSSEFYKKQYFKNACLLEKSKSISELCKKKNLTKE